MKRFASGDTCPICQKGGFWGCPCGDPFEDYRHTPAGQKTVADLVTRGMEIATSYNTGGIVTEVRGPFPYGVHESYSITYIDADKWTTRRAGNSWINELVAVDGRILMLFAANQDEVFIRNATPRMGENKRGQLALF